MQDFLQATLFLGWLFLDHLPYWSGLYLSRPRPRSRVVTPFPALPVKTQNQAQLTPRDFLNIFNHGTICCQHLTFVWLLWTANTPPVEGLTFAHVLRICCDKMEKDCWNATNVGTSHVGWYPNVLLPSVPAPLQGISFGWLSLTTVSHHTQYLPKTPRSKQQDLPLPKGRFGNFLHHLLHAFANCFSSLMTRLTLVWTLSFTRKGEQIESDKMIQKDQKASTEIWHWPVQALWLATTCKNAANGQSARIYSSCKRWRDFINNDTSVLLHKHHKESLPRGLVSPTTCEGGNVVNACVLRAFNLRH